MDARLEAGEEALVRVNFRFAIRDFAADASASANRLSTP